MHEEGGRNSRWAEDKEGKRQNALRRIVDLKPSLENEDTSLQQVGNPSKRDTFLQREECAAIPVGVCQCFKFSFK